MAKILINDGIDPNGLAMLRAAGHEVSTTNIPQADLLTQLQSYDAICVRSATKVRQDLIDACPNLKVIGRGGVGIDNIDFVHARGKGIHVINTPAASSRSVAELVFSHVFATSRFIHQSNREMPTQGVTHFNALKKAYADGFELKGKTMGIIGLGRIGCEVAKMALGLGMNVVGFDLDTTPKILKINIGNQSMDYTLTPSHMDTVLAESDFITLHVPSTDKPILGAAEIAKMKAGVKLFNTARGGSIDEEALLAALDSGHVAAAGLDVFENEPTPDTRLINHPKISVTPHIGASTAEAQSNIGAELAQQLIDLLG